MSLSNLIDTHAHLDFDRYDSDREDVILRAAEAGVSPVINIGTNIPTSRFSVELAQKYESIYAAVGIHPHDSKEMSDDSIRELQELYEQPKVVAIGEIGLDYFKMYQSIKIQENAFRRQLELALDLNAPIIVHSRSANEETIHLLQDVQFTGWSGVFHCFPGGKAMAEQVLEMGFHISYTGSITFKNSKAAYVIEHIPLNRLLLETDCPFMSPVPHRGKRNEPAYIHFVGQKIAEIKNIPFETVARQTTRNAIELFGI